MSDEWDVRASDLAKKTHNPIRHIVDNMKIRPNQEKSLISLSIGDPTVFGNLSPPEVAINAVTKAVLECKHNGYAPAVGHKMTRDALARYYSRSGMEITGDDVILTCGCSGAIELALSSLVNPGDNILSPKPGFMLYETTVKGFGVDVRYYNLMPERSWEVDLEDMINLIDEKTRAIIIINPSNPCGSVYSKEHLLAILDVAEHFKLPIVADEVYADMVFSDVTFHRIASLTRTVPVLSCGGIAKRFICPGWRLGWIFVFDRNGILSKEVKPSLRNLSQRILGPNTLIQAAIPEMLENTPKSYYDGVMTVVEDNAALAYDFLKGVPGLYPVKPQGALYMMIGINFDQFVDFKDDLQFTELLIKEESVFCLPGRCFKFPRFFRIVLTVPHEKMYNACHRISDFCRAHRVSVNE